MQNSAKKMPKNTVINIKQQLSKSHIFGFLPLQHCPPPLDTRPPHSHIMFTVLIHVFGISGVLYHGGGTMFHKIIPVLVDYIVQNGHIDLKISKIIPHFEIFLADTDDLLSGN